MPEGKHVFGVVGIGEKGQIVIPKRAREIFGLKPGDQLLVLGDEAQGIALVKAEKLAGFAAEILSAMAGKGEEP
ncbi:MAG: AbrB/MazE/SpoVT family DNA-binding domain-containing protein [Clostridia bacterium]|nr:AbrB/MazE/SpoVT family DNA-binding domain-containing protein [Clostridia bacterium]